VIYRGVPGEVAGISLNWPEEETPLNDELVERLPLSVQRGLDDGITVDSLDDARSLADRYVGLATRFDSLPEIDESAPPEEPM
jgi:hypothetical protein